MDLRFSRVHRSQIHCTPRVPTSIDHEAGRSSVVVPQWEQVAASVMPASVPP